MENGSSQRARQFWSEIFACVTLIITEARNRLSKDGGDNYKKLALLLAVLFCLNGFGTTANAIGISINVGDQPYYVHGPGYGMAGVTTLVPDIGVGDMAIKCGFTAIIECADNSSSINSVMSLETLLADAAAKAVERSR